MFQKVSQQQRTDRPMLIYDRCERLKGTTGTKCVTSRAESSNPPKHDTGRSNTLPTGLFHRLHCVWLCFIMNALRLLRGACRPALASRFRIVAPRTVPVRFFSDASSTQSKPIIPGIGKGKTSTGIVGLKVEPDWYNVMLNRFQALLDKMEASDMPETAQYRIDVTKWCNFVIRAVKSNPEDPEAVEETVQMGQVEELIEMAEDEMIALDTYLRTRMWELVEATNTVYDFEHDPMKDPMGKDGDPDLAEAIRRGVDAMKTQKEN